MRCWRRAVPGALHRGGATPPWLGGPHHAGNNSGRAGIGGPCARGSCDAGLRHHDPQQCPAWSRHPGCRSACPDRPHDRWPALAGQRLKPLNPPRLRLFESQTRSGELGRWLGAAAVRGGAQPRRRFAHFCIAYEAALAGSSCPGRPSFYGIMLPGTAATRARAAPFLDCCMARSMVWSPPCPRRPKVHALDGSSAWTACAGATARGDLHSG